jgi:hypothetical protein
MNVSYQISIRQVLMPEQEIINERRAVRNLIKDKGTLEKAKAREELNAALKILPDYISAKITLDRI